MADLAIAKAAFAASLMRSDPSPLSRGAVDEITVLLNKTLDECSRSNVQKCKNWIVAHIVASPGRTTLLGKYLVALSESLDTDFDRPSVKKRRLRLLYIVNDVLHHAIVKLDNQKLVPALEPHLPAMIAAASTFERSPSHLAKVSSLIDLWQERQHLPAAVIDRLHDSFSRASDKNSGTRIHMTDDELEQAKAAPYVLPEQHGEPLGPWNDLPAAALFHQLRPNSTIPLRRGQMHPMQLKPGPDWAAIQQAVSQTISDVDDLFSPDNAGGEIEGDLNALGEKGRLNQETGELETGSYYGWSRAFSQQQKARSDRPASPSPRGRKRQQSPR
ncbi:hypothetical protein CDD82_5400 [Ophiocordyceps australis]|uniref:CID domain-containing protein n=1 Tax=Ophiocordyceps australis TaxID=1399860 RepID=A0A2C5Z2V3_9HYPO|nr:hypothetical protein CDD82_5400 [Ophiocordyceps australis]